MSLEVVQLKRQVDYYRKLNYRYRKHLERYLIEIRAIETYLDSKGIPNIKNENHAEVRQSSCYSLFDRIKLLGGDYDRYTGT